MPQWTSPLPNEGPILPCTGKCLKHLLIKLMIPLKIKQKRLSRADGKRYMKQSKTNPEEVYNIIYNL